MPFNKSIGTNLSRIKIINQFSIREVIYRFGPISRLDIAERLGLTLPTVTTNISSMLANGIIKEVGKSSKDDGCKTLGRKTMLIDISEDSRYFIGVEIRQGFRRVVLTNLRGTVLSCLSDDAFFRDYEDAVNNASLLVKQMIKSNVADFSPISAIGICLPGLVDSENGELKIQPNYKWFDKDVVLDFSKLLGMDIPIYLENNAIARAYGLSIFDSKQLKKADTLAYMFVSAGIACPMLNNVRLHFGNIVGEGEVGHMIMNPDGPECGCGNHGCLEAYSSENAIRKKYEASLKNEDQDRSLPSIKDIIEKQMQGDKVADDVIDEAIFYLGLSIANIDNFVHPECVAIECKLFDNDENRKALLDVIHSNLYRETFSDYRFIFIKSDDYSGARGAAAIAVKHTLELYIRG